MAATCPTSSESMRPSDLHHVQRDLTGVLKYKVVDRSFLPAFIFSHDQLVITIGQDGLLANAAKYVGRLPMIGVNPDPARYDGVLLPYTSGTCRSAVESVLAGSYATRNAFLAEASLNDGQRLLAFNDLFIGVDDHTSARYNIAYKGAEEEQSSSGIIVSTCSGSTGWLSSVYNMVNGLLGNSGKVQHKHQTLSEDELQFVVREPFLSQRTGISVSSGRLQGGTPLVVRSLMPRKGVIFSDGIGADHLKFNSGSIAKIGLAKERACLVIPK